MFGCSVVTIFKTIDSMERENDMWVRVGVFEQMISTLHAVRCGQNLPKPNGGVILRRRLTTSRCFIRPLREGRFNSKQCFRLKKSSGSYPSIGRGEEEQQLTSLRDRIPTKDERIHRDDEVQEWTNLSLNNQNYP